VGVPAAVAYRAVPGGGVVAAAAAGEGKELSLTRIPATGASTVLVEKADIGAGVEVVDLAMVDGTARLRTRAKGADPAKDAWVSVSTSGSLAPAAAPAER
jgi:hypothetical protein